MINLTGKHFKRNKTLHLGPKIFFYSLSKSNAGCRAKNVSHTPFAGCLQANWKYCAYCLCELNGSHQWCIKLARVQSSCSSPGGVFTAHCLLVALTIANWLFIKHNLELNLYQLSLRTLAKLFHFLTVMISLSSRPVQNCMIFFSSIFVTFRSAVLRQTSFLLFQLRCRALLFPW